MMNENEATDPALTPEAIFNRPGLSELNYRVGTYGSFLDTMHTRLSTLQLPDLASLYPLKNLTTRESDDPTIALLDAWATLADVLTFYQERIANEGFLATATERRSLVELARLVGYELRPGVAASVYLAYTLEKNSGKVVIPPGSRSQTVPGPSQLPQSFETGEPLAARSEWNNLQARLHRPQYITPARVAATIQEVYLQSTATNLKVNDRLLFVFENTSNPVLRQVNEVSSQTAWSRTKVNLQPVYVIPTERFVDPPAASFDQERARPVGLLAGLIDSLAGEPDQARPANREDLNQSLTEVLAPNADFVPRLLALLYKEGNLPLYRAWANAVVTLPRPLLNLAAMRTRALPFGANAGLMPVYDGRGMLIDHTEWFLGPPHVFSIRFSGPLFEQLLPTTDLKAAAEASQAEIMVRKGNEVQTTRESLTLFYVTPDTQKLGVTIGLSIDMDEQPKITLRVGDTPGKAALELYLLPNIHKTTIRLNFQDPDSEQPVPYGTLSHFTLYDKSKVEVSFDNASLFFTLYRVAPAPKEDWQTLALDSLYSHVTPGQWVVIEREDRRIIAQVSDVQAFSKAAYNLTGRVTQLKLSSPWLDENDLGLEIYRNTSVYLQNESWLPPERRPTSNVEPLLLAEAPIDEPVKGSRLELSQLYEGLEAGRWLIVAGERNDITTDNPASSGKVPVNEVFAQELVMVSRVFQQTQQITDDNGNVIELPGDKIHTFIELAAPLAYSYKLATVTIYGNVVAATHGESRSETLGSGDGSATFQAFTLHQSPLTYLSASTPSGIRSALEVRVNEVLWQEAASLVDLGPTDRKYVLQTDDRQKTTITFGDGIHGARLPTGLENVKAELRVGPGAAGNAEAGQISLLMSRPLGVKSVTNPLPASGGNNPETLDEARVNTPLSVLTLDRLVSVQDYQDFARTFAGIGKVSAMRLSDRRRQCLHLTVAGRDDLPLNADLVHNLHTALLKYCDPGLTVRIDTRELLLLIIEANVRLQPEYRWKSVAPQIRAVLLETFGFAKREIGQAVFLSEVIRAIQSVKGVLYTDVDSLLAVKMDDLRADPSNLKNLIVPTVQPIDIQLLPARTAPGRTWGILPAQLAYLSPDLPDTILLKELT